MNYLRTGFFIAVFVLTFMPVLSQTEQQNSENDIYLFSPEYFFNKNFPENFIPREALTIQKENFRAALGVLLYTDFSYVNNSDLNSQSDFSDQLWIIHGFLGLMLQAHLGSWLQLMLTMENNSFPGGDESEQNYFPNTPSIISVENYFYPGQMYVRLFMTTAGIPIRITLGKQNIKGIVDYHDGYSTIAFPQEIQGLLINANSAFGNLNFLALDILNLYQNWILPPALYGKTAKVSSDIIGNFQGDALSFRSGIIYQTPDIFKNTKPLKWYWNLSTLFTRYGPVITGIDRADGTGKYSDNDYIFHYGLTTYLKWINFSVLLESCLSNGVDRKLPDLFGNSMDISANGLFLRTGIFWDIPAKSPARHILELNVMYSEGPVMNTTGTIANYGFTAPGLQDFGGFLLNHVWGFKPYSMSLNNGVVHNRSNGYYHSSGAISVNLAYKVLFQTLGLYFQSRFLFDSAIYNEKLNIFTDKTIFPNFQSRYIGNENIISVIIKMNTMIQWFFSAEIFIPGESFLYVKNGIFSDKDDSFYGFIGGLKIIF